MAKYEPILTRNVGVPNSWEIEVALKHGDYEALPKAIAEYQTGSDHRSGQELRLARPRRRWGSHRHEVGLRPEGQAREVSRGE